MAREAENNEIPSSDDLLALLDEMSNGVDDKTRTIEKVSNPAVRKLLEQASAKASQNGNTASLANPRLQVAGCVGLFWMPTLVIDIGIHLYDLWMQKKNDEEKERLKQEVETKQNKIISGLAKDIEELREKYTEIVNELKRCIELMDEKLENKEKELDELKKKYAQAQKQIDRNEYIVASFIALSGLKGV